MTWEQRRQEAKAFTEHIEKEAQKHECSDCGWEALSAGGFVYIYPSDCHDKGGHYQIYFDQDGHYLGTNAPWQVSCVAMDMTPCELAEAKRQ